MNAKETLAKNLSDNHQKILQDPNKAKLCFIGFDGFTDEIVKAVDQRSSGTDFLPLRKMADFGQRVLDFAGKSCNIELVTSQTKIGGNAPILTNALIEGGHRIIFTGAIGTKEEIEPLFQDMVARIEKAIPLCPSGHSDAIEFQDGKVILGKHDKLMGINYDSIIDAVGKEALIQTLDQADLFISANWTMLPKMTDVWEKIHLNIVPSLSIRGENNPRFLFVDIADPQKRSDVDIFQAINALQKLNEKAFKVILGLNEAESLRIAKVLGLDMPGGSVENIKKLTSAIFERAKLSEIVIHATKFAAGKNKREEALEFGVYTENPVLTTGAGDNFNAGFVNALLYELPLSMRLLSGVATAGFYILNGHSPSISELANFLKNW